MNDPIDPGRRAVLSAAAGGGLAALAGCLSNPWSPGADAEESDPESGGMQPASDGDAAMRSDGDGAEQDAIGNETDGTTTDGTDGGEPETPPEPDLIVDVAADGYRFSPESFELPVGGTVKWVWRSSGHNVRVDSKPDGSDWTGTAGGATDTYDKGHELLFTFETPGQYEYYCAPHRSLGLRGSFTVVE